MNELISHGCILQGREKLAAEILARHLENEVAVAEVKPVEESHIPASVVLDGDEVA